MLRRHFQALLINLKPNAAFTSHANNTFSLNLLIEYETLICAFEYAFVVRIKEIKKPL